MGLCVDHANDLTKYFDVLFEICAEHYFHRIVPEDLLAEILCFFDLIWVVRGVLPSDSGILLGSLVLVSWVARELVIISRSIFLLKSGL